MKLAISNIAWDNSEESEILETLQKLGVTGIEIAPTKIWPEWANINLKDVSSYRVHLNNLGFHVPSMQAILFGKPNLQLFKKETHREFLDHIRHVADIAGELGAKVLVFGAPKNRKRGQISFSSAKNIAKEFFCNAGEICESRGCCLGIEHNPVEYECDYITNAADAYELVKEVDHPGIKLHLDSAGIHMCGGDISDVIKNSGEFVHYHISEPMLSPIVNGEVDHRSASIALDAIGYNKWVSIEMKQPSNNKLLYDSIIYATKNYRLT